MKIKFISMLRIMPSNANIQLTNCFVEKTNQKVLVMAKLIE